MAVLDFPSAPVNGQLFTGTNNVVYQWQAVPGIWIAVGNVGAQADFCATNPASITPSTSGASVGGALTTVISGNSGGWFNPTTGRFTPPPGRYSISATAKFQTASAAALGYAYVYKNGVRVGVEGGMTTGGATFSGFGSSQVVVDASGTDYFEMWTFGQGGGGNTINANNAVFSAIPVFSIQGPTFPSSPVGDFMAQNSAAIGVGATTVQVILNTIITGNSGGWYNATNGRFTPPPGRFYISFTVGALANAAGATIAQAILRKNGAQVAIAKQVPGNSSWQGDPNAFGIFNCNGTDYFEVFAVGNAAGATIEASAAVFIAFPLGGAVGPPGPPGPMPVGNYWRQLKRIVPTAGQATVDFVPADIPSDINDLMYTVANVVPQSNDVGFFIRFADAAGTFDTGNNYNSAMALAQNSQSLGGASPVSMDLTALRVTYNATGNGVSATAGQGMSIEGKVLGIRNSAARRVVTWHGYYLQGSNTSQNNLIGSGQWNNVTSILGGVRFYFGSGGFQAGGAITLWGSP